MKLIVKYAVGVFRAKLARVDISGMLYIGSRTKIIGGKNIHLGKYCCIRPETDIWTQGGGVVIGEGTEIGQRCRISIINNLKIGKHVLFSPNCYLTDCDHAYMDVSKPVIAQGVIQDNNTVEIGDGCYIGINTVIVGNVKIGRHVVVGANSVVTHDLPDYSVAVGAPARVVKVYNFTSAKWEKVNR